MMIVPALDRGFEVRVGRAEADTERKGLINSAGLAHYVATRVASLTGGAQTPGMELRFHSTLFATAAR